MKKWLSALLMANAIDASATMYVLLNSLAEEHNPLVKLLFSWHPAVFLAAKTLFAGASVSAVLSRPDDPQTRGWLTGVTVFYCLLSVYQVLVLLYLWR